MKTLFALVAAATLFTAVPAMADEQNNLPQVSASEHSDLNTNANPEAFWRPGFGWHRPIYRRYYWRRPGFGWRYRCGIFGWRCW